MECINVMVVDDEDISCLFSDKKNINVETCRPYDFAEDMKCILSSHFDAIIMDQKLTGVKRSIPYLGTTLIQEMRNRMVKSNGGLSPKPIILWSIASNIDSYFNEKSSHNLTDAVWRKDRFGSEDTYAKDCIDQLIDLVNGYALLNKLNSKMSAEKHLRAIFNVENDRLSIIPHQFYVFFDHASNRKPHLISQFILNSVIRFNGPLIDFDTVLARLGLSKHSENLDKIEKKLANFKYKGIYSCTHSRWWSQGIEEWWLNSIDSRFPASLTAVERVALLRSKLKLKLEPATFAKGHNSSYFWYACPFTSQPVDPSDSFKIVFPEKREWQDDIYISYHAAKTREYKKNGYSLDPVDKDKLLKMVRS